MTARFPHFGDLLAIDPGCEQSGYVRIREGRILQAGVLPNTFMLAAINGFFRDQKDVELQRDDWQAFTLVEEGLAFPSSPFGRRVAIEMIQNMGMIVGREVFETVFFAGRCFERANEHGCDAELCYRPKIKAHLCGAAHAKDANIRQVLIDRWGAPGTKKAPGATYNVKTHAWSALAVASYALDNPQEPRHVA